MISKERYEKFLEKERMVTQEVKRIENTVIAPTDKVQSFLEENGSTLLKSGAKLAELLRRPELNYEKLAVIDDHRPVLPYEVKEEAAIKIKYEGYIKQQLNQVQQFKKLEKRLIPVDIDYTQMKGLRLEAIQKLSQIRPTSIGHASRITGVSPADISVLLIHLEQNKGRKIENEDQKTE